MMESKLLRVNLFQKKNNPAENFYENFGFKKQDSFWIFDTDQPIKKPTNLKMKIENE